MNDGAVILKVRGLRKKFKSAGAGLTILDGVDLDVLSGSMTYIVGRSGAGKSTLLYLLGGLDDPGGGTVEYRGLDINRFSEKERAKFRNRHLGFVFQFYHLLPELALMENLLLPAWLAGKKSSEAAKRAHMLLGEMDLADRDHHFPSQLSGGELQRAAIARALMNEPDLVLCDEPTGNLDRETAEKSMQLILRLNKDLKQTFCIVTHEEAMVKDQPHVFRLEGGRLHALDTSRSLHK